MEEVYNIKTSGEKRKKLLCLLCALVFIPCAYGMTPYWDIGKVTLSGTRKNGSWYAGTSLTLGMFYFMEDSTGLYAAVSPCRAELVYNSDLENSAAKNFPWNTLAVTFVNLEAGWSTFLGSNFLFLPFVRVNALNTADIRDVALSSGVELSWIHPIVPFTDLDYPMLPKIISLEAGIQVETNRGFVPAFYCSLGINLGICLAALSGR
jgi:hypothetical protein